MKKNIGIWIDTKQATIIRLSKNNEHFIKKIASNIETRVRVPGESKKFGRFGGQYITYEKNRENKKNEQINLFFKELFKEIENCDALVIFGPAKMKKLLEKEIRNNMQFSRKLLGVHNSDILTENQIIAWVKDYYDN
ncbi:hypothetical protein MHL31_04075 [Lutibacter sp. A80]|uniref:hypothetical protein n=1 Tax=Lutibacter sp. A80 TaxID=2918453 RepID=UPI001F05532E|nr:hypothetical protein [Lutibacter sp. A80]UMB61386.1 hypothetical protein MHL31_04075 [Lutibacter sp. A80]